MTLFDYNYMEYKSASEKDTHALGVDFAKRMDKGCVLGLVGDLGAGKTVFVQGLAEGLGVKQHLTSPTFVIMKVYDVLGNAKIKKLVHIDAYRITSADDLVAIGADEYFKQEDTVVIVEWAEEIKKILPPKTRFITINIAKGNNRLILFEDQ